MFENRNIYRSHHRKPGLVSFDVTIFETNLHIQADSDLTACAREAVLSCRQEITDHIRRYPAFADSLTPLPPVADAPPVVSGMLRAANQTGVGPMAAVAGAVAKCCGRMLMPFSREVIVENGGDIFIASATDTLFSIYAGNSPLSMTTGILVPRQPRPFGLCTSSGTLGHSISFGRADAVTVMAEDCALADAAATALANRILSFEDIPQVLDAGKAIPGITGLVMIAGARIGLWGDLRLVRLTDQ